MRSKRYSSHLIPQLRGAKRRYKTRIIAIVSGAVQYKRVVAASSRVHTAHVRVRGVGVRAIASNSTAPRTSARASVHCVGFLGVERHAHHVSGSGRLERDDQRGFISSKQVSNE